jgi:hypothetical protein
VALDIAELLVAIELCKDSSWHRKNLGSSSDANGEFVEREDPIELSSRDVEESLTYFHACN